MASAGDAGYEVAAKPAAPESIKTEMKMVNLIEKLSVEAECFKTYAHLQHELLRRVDQDAIFEDESSRKAYDEKEQSVFDRVDQHKSNEASKLDMFDEQFRKVHAGMDHKTFTEKWLLEQTSEEVQLEKVLENPTFQDFVGVFDILPMAAYVASKMIIDESDFMGIFDLAGDKPHIKAPKGENLPPTGSFNGVSSEAMWAEMARLRTKEEAAEDSQEENTTENQASDRALDCVVEGCGCSDVSVKPHALGAGQYLQFRLRQGNVMPYLGTSVAATRLKGLIPNDPMEPIYVFTASANGIMRFHPWGGIKRKLWHGYGDSETAAAFPINIKHAGEYGCFCFGVIYREKENYEDSNGKLKKGGRTFVMRYNRWATDNAPIYAMVRQRADERDVSVPEPNLLTWIYADRMVPGAYANPLNWSDKKSIEKTMKEVQVKNNKFTRPIFVLEYCGNTERKRYKAVSLEELRQKHQAEEINALYHWQSIEHGEQIPEIAVSSGSNQSFVGRFQGEAGEIKATGTKMNYFSASSHSTLSGKRQTAEILCCEAPHRWQEVQRGELIPKGAVLAGETYTDGVNYVALFKGSLGKINTEDGKMYSCWCSGWQNHPHSAAEILIVEDLDTRCLQEEQVKEGQEQEEDQQQQQQRRRKRDVVNHSASETAESLIEGASSLAGGLRGKVGSLFGH